MKFFATAFFSLCAISQSIATVAPHGTTDNTLSIEIPPGYPANGTIVADIEKAIEYLHSEAGIDINKFLSYAAKIPRPQTGVEYPFPSGSGLEESSVTFTKDVAVPGNQDSVQNDCDWCYIDCIIWSIIPPAWAICMGICASKGCVPP